MTRTAIIIGAGPAGLTAAYELVTRTDIKPAILEAGHQVGGISRTVNYKGNRIDIGGHRFFSKSQRVMEWWEKILPFQSVGEVDGLTLTYHNQTTEMRTGRNGPNPEETDDVMLVRPRVSRILYDRKFFDYPISFSVRTLMNLGVGRSFRIGVSYLRAIAFPIRPERSLRDFIINRFGRELYLTFFESYTEKVWGVPCEKIPAEWGAQRIKGLSIVALIKNVLQKMRPQERDEISQMDTETSLIERFLYPKLGPGQLWEKVAREVVEKGGELHLEHRVVGLTSEGGKIASVDVVGPNGVKRCVEGDLVFSTMPVRDLVQSLKPAAPKSVAEVASGLIYRDFLTVGVLLDRLAINGGATAEDLSRKVPDNWIYVQDPDVTVGRIQIFNNWSPYLVSEPDRIWVGLEYFVSESDEIWTQPDETTIAFAVAELDRLGFSTPEAVQDAIVVRTPKAYPAYFGTYDRIQEVRDFVSGFNNLFLIGRNGMHRYNNQDHSMLTAMVAVDGIVDAVDNRDSLWDINTEQDYHEER
ncbi:NAD(P)/FAD-dependent oxidoreductase [Marivita geojedonensis]|uniref:Amine oxidase domain-containing protein n=1 Tax=Marivita geojedonensis TaxID=1123756 RepID=A0A1X4NCE5_9RHOB|nr:NAD(P)/FAD-dependent oxidoreductase [Marivita geojedonensis]OSQ44334.1 hypothetical protein MGEO_19170 [Marivita geojedonensis]PRY72895.1 UDP-galactopyranose mutase [Marivita geojedonensis]